ncbi:hypothetical protein [Mycolicibacterium phlei]|uniref:hypothetical protein n=1 Tax=Mycolicibacterium phlei TaxID=1771 RepID=UPI0037C4FC87
MTVAAPRVAIWWTTNADSSSSRWASSTQRTTSAVRSEGTSASITPRSSVRVSVTPVDAHEVKAPSGMLRAEVVPAVQRVMRPRAAARASASRAVQLLPTPSGPQMSTPDVDAAIAASRTCICCVRPTNGHDRRTF